MFLADNETAVDLLNNKAIANVISEMIFDDPLRPITVGVHGDWGAGKSSILKMLEEKFSKDNDIVCILFNGWKFQGFCDAKISIIEGIITEITNKRSKLKKSSEIVKKIFKRIDWFKFARYGGQLAFNSMTGFPTFSQAKTICDNAIEITENPSQLKERVNQENFLKLLQESINPEKQIRLPEEINEFHHEFENLLKEGNIKQLVVLIDDLDRCLPNVVIETLEAVRLFLFVKQTAFIIAADEVMVEYSVQKYFPQQSESLLPNNYAKNYLEKLIQVPFRIPSLGEFETKIYVMLLLIGAKIGEKDTDFSKLVKSTHEILKKPWEAKGLTDSFLREELGTKFDSVKQEIALCNQISLILARGTQGNPRQIKRFINALFLRYSTAMSRGFGEDVKLPILAKVMLAERFQRSLFEKIIRSVPNDKEGFCKEITELENMKTDITEKKSVKGKGSKQSEKETKLIEIDSEENLQWINLSPSLKNVDLRPYLFITKDLNQFNYTSPRSSHLVQLTNKLFGPEMIVHSTSIEVQQLSENEAIEVFEMISERIIENGNFENKPSGVVGMILLVKNHPKLQSRLLDYLRSFPTEKCGSWLVTGWKSAIIEDEYKLEFKGLLKKWASSSNKVLKNAAEITLK